MSKIRAAWTWLLNLVRGTDSDLEGTYPEHYRPTGEEAATQGSVTAGLMNGGGPLR